MDETEGKQPKMPEVWDGSWNLVAGSYVDEGGVWVLTPGDRLGFLLEDANRNEFATIAAAGTLNVNQTTGALSFQLQVGGKGADADCILISGRQSSASTGSVLAALESFLKQDGSNQYDSHDKNSGVAPQASFALWGPSGSVWAVYG